MLKVVGLLCATAAFVALTFMFTNVARSVTAEHRHSAEVCIEHGGI